MDEKLTRWFIFGVAIACMPVAFNAVRLVMRGWSPTFEALTGRGELLLVAAAISARALGDLIGSGVRMKVGKILAGGAAVLMLLIASFAYADVTASLLNGQSLEKAVISHISLALFGGAVGVGGGCVALAQVK